MIAKSQSPSSNNFVVERTQGHQHHSIGEFSFIFESKERGARWKVQMEFNQ